MAQKTTKKAKKPVAKSKPKAKLPAKIPSVWQLTRTTSTLLRQYWKVLFGITLVYGVLNLILVRGVSSTGSFAGSPKNVSNTVADLLNSNSASSSGSAGAYQLFLGIMASLAIIWAIRQLVAGHTIKIRDAYYRGMYPLVPFIIILLVLALELLPLIIGTGLYSLVTANGIAATAIEKILWLSVLLFGLLATLYMFSSSLFALYIVTLPDMTPRKALRSARELVYKRRFKVVRKILVLPVVLCILFTVILVPFILALPGLAQWVFYLMTITVLTVVHTYMYNLYRELLQ